MQEVWVRSLGWEDPLEKEMANHSRILSWEDRGVQRATVQGVAKSWTSLSEQQQQEDNVDASVTPADPSRFLSCQ